MASRSISSASAARWCCWRSASAIAARSARSRSRRSRARARSWARTRRTCRWCTSPSIRNATTPRRCASSSAASIRPSSAASARAPRSTRRRRATASRRRRQCNADGSYTIGHSSSIYMIDRAGGLRAVMPYGHTVDDFVHDLKILLRELNMTKRRAGSRLPLLAAARGAGMGGFRAARRAFARRAVRDSEGHLCAAHGGRQGGDPAVANSPDARVSTTCCCCAISTMCRRYSGPRS